MSRLIFIPQQHSIRQNAVIIFFYESTLKSIIENVFTEY